MESLHLLKEALCRTPEDPALLNALKDELMESKGYNPAKAQEWVDYYQMCGRDAHNLTIAAAVLACTGPVRNRALRRIGRCVWDHSAFQVVVYLVPGSLGPTAKIMIDPETNKPFEPVYATVGANWVLLHTLAKDLFEALDRQRHPKQNRKRRAR